MKWNSRRSHIAFPALVVLVACSCGKGTVDGSKSSRMLGKWLEVQFATDDNANGVMDSWEVHNVGKNVVDVMVFNKDSSGYESVHAEDSTMTYPFTWVYLSGDSISRSGIGHDTVTYQITKITSVNLTLMNYTVNGRVWYLFNKN